jgi:4-aminobutyrate--pyruvate transaminase
MSFAPNSPAARDVAYTLHPYTNLVAHEARGPHIMTRGEGIYVWDDDGKQYIEGLAGLWCASLGFSEPRLAEAAKRQLDTLPFMHTFSHRSTLPVIELCERLIETAPGDLAKVYLVNSGSEAVDTAIKFVWYYSNALDRPEKKKIISRRRAYHGVTVAAGSLSALAYVQNGFDLPVDRFVQTDTPCHYRYGEPGESEADFATRLADSLDALIEAEGPDTVGAFIAEPVMGAGGVMPPPETYFDKVQAVLRKHDVLMIADEVICGFGRTGNRWGSETYGIQPDILTCAKQLSAAFLPIGAVMVSDKVYDAFTKQSATLGNFGQGNTYGGHPVPAAVALETQKIYEERDILGHVRRVAPHFQAHLAELGEHPLVGDARGVGLIGGVELVADKATKESYPAAVKAAVKASEKAVKHGLFVRALPSDVLGICPPLIITEDEIDELFGRLRKGLDDAHGELANT